MFISEELQYAENFDLTSIQTPINAEVFKQLLTEANYDIAKTNKIYQGFKNGFSLEYSGDTQVQLTSPNLKLNVGNEVILWNKIIKEVRLERFAGPYKSIPFDHYIQSPVGLVPKDNR